MVNGKYQVLKRQKPWRDAYFYQKSEVLYQLTFTFCQRFLARHGDRTVDQMVQAARSGKQNIIEGTEDGETSTEMHIKLLNVARASLQELREDYRDYLISRDLPIWDVKHNRYNQLREFCRNHNKLEDYQPFFNKWNDEEMANLALTLYFMTNTLLNNHLKKLEEEFITEGGIKERMHAARTHYRREQDAELGQLRNQVLLLKAEIERLKQLLIKHGIDF